jgi:hypothetical protein
MGKKARKAILGAALIVVGVVTQQYGALGKGLSLIGSALVAAGVNTVLSVAVSAFTRTPRTRPNPLNITVRGTIEYRRLVFGRRRCGGVLVFYGTSGAENKYLWYVIAYAGHQCSAFGDFWLDERRIAAANIPGGGGGAVTGFNGKLNIWTHLGTSSQTVDTNLSSAFGAWNSTHRLQGICYAVIRMERDDSVFPDGAPQSVSALIDGMLTYDPRLDSTNGGSGSQRADNPSTWAFSRDPVQHIRWYLTGGSVVNDVSTRQIMYGLREIDSKIDDAYTIASSNICDEILSGANAPPSGDQPRYRCDLEVSCGESRREILAALLASMAGTLTYVQGKWRIYAGAYDMPLHTLTDKTDLYGDLEVQDTVGHDARYNAVAPVFIDASNQYIQTTGGYRTDAAYEAQDGNERISTELVLDAVTDQYQAQRLAEIHLRKSRMMRSVKFIGALDMLRVALHETLVYSDEGFGWTNRIFRAKERQLEFTEDAGRVTLIAQRDDPGVWADLLTADYTTGTSNTDVFQQDGPSTPTNLVVTSLPLGIEFDVTLPPYVHPGSIVELWEHTASTPFGSATKIAEGIATKYFVRKLDTVTRYYWVRIRSPDGAVSGTFPASAGLPGAADTLAASADVDTPADGSINYPPSTQPTIENAGLNASVDYTAPSGQSARVQVSWSAQAQISNTTSGTAVGFAGIFLTVQINSTTVYTQNVKLEGNTTATNIWGTLAGTRTFDVAPTQHLQAFLVVGRSFSSSGSSPAQTIFWRQALLEAAPLKG